MIKKFYGFIAIAFGSGILVGGIFPSVLFLWLFGIFLICAGILLIRCR